MSVNTQHEMKDVINYPSKIILVNLHIWYVRFIV